MEQIIFRPKLYKFDTLKAFTDEFKVGGSDLILTNIIKTKDKVIFWQK